MSTDEGNVIEGTRSNFFAVLDGQLMTPEIRLAGVKGVMRAFLMDRFSADGITVLEVALSHEELFTATELFLCNSVSGVWPVTSLENRERKKQFAVGPMSKKALGYQYDEFAKLDKSQ